jgi:hypothetical protein
MRAISPMKGNFAVGQGNETVVGNCDSMRVAAQVSEHVFRTTERPFAVDHPVMAEQLTDERVEGLRIRKVLQFAVKAEFALYKRILKSLRELGSKHDLQHLFRQEKAVAWVQMDPRPMIKRQSTRRNNAVDVWMMFEFLSPGVKYAEETDLGTQVFWIAGDFDQSLSTQTEQKRVDKPLVLECKWRQQMRQGEDDVRIRDREKLLPSPVYPAPTGIGLTFRTVPITTRVVGLAGGIPATGTRIDMAAESSGTTAFNRLARPSDAGV